MNRCEQIHETIVRDVFDIVNDIRDFDEVDWINKRNNTGSIARRSGNLTLIFPVIVSSSVSIETAMIVTKAIERKCVSLMQILFSSMQLTKADNMADYIKQFHTNMNMRSGLYNLDDLIRFTDDLVDVGEAVITDVDAYEALREDAKNLNFYIEDNYNESSINDFKVRKRSFNESLDIIHEARKTKPRSDAARNRIKVTPAITQGKEITDYHRYQIIQNDYDKANELLPTLLQVNFVTVKDGAKVINTGIVGIKAKMYPVDSMEIVNRLSSKYSDSNTFFNLIRATTREISFFKDFAFAIEKAKLDAISLGKDAGNAKVFKLLERRAAKNRFATLLKMNDASPITSLVISSEDVEYVKKYTTNIDLDKESTCRTIMNAYNLMDIVIANESIEYAKFLYDDGDSMFETITFDALQKSSRDSSSYKKIINLMAKMNR